MTPENRVYIYKYRNNEFKSEEFVSAVLIVLWSIQIGNPITVLLETKEMIYESADANGGPHVEGLWVHKNPRGSKN